MAYLLYLRVIAIIMLAIGTIGVWWGFLTLSYTYCSPFYEFCGQPFFGSSFILFSGGAVITLAAARLLLPSEEPSPAKTAEGSPTLKPTLPKRFTMHFHASSFAAGLALLGIGAALLLLRLPRYPAETLVAMVSTLLGMGLSSMELVNTLERWMNEKRKVPDRLSRTEDGDSESNSNE